MKTMLAIVAILIVALLAAYAVWLHYRLWQQKKAIGSASAAQFRRVPERGHVGVNKSIYLIADALLDQKVTHTEACLRISALAVGVEDPEMFRREYGVMFQVAEATGHIPILDEWRALSRDEKTRYNKVREAIEQKYADAVVDAAQRIKTMFADVMRGT